MKYTPKEKCYEFLVNNGLKLRYVKTYRRIEFAIVL